MRTGHIYGVARPALRSRYLATKNSTHTPKEATIASNSTSLIRIHYKSQKDISNSDKGKSKLFSKSHLVRQSQHKRSHYKTYTQISHLICQELLPHIPIKPRRVRL